MAPSRALLRCVATVRTRPSPHRLLTTFSARNQYIRPATILHTAHSAAPLRTSTQLHLRRAYSQSQPEPQSEPQSNTLEPPDYLSEGELHIFNKIKAELEPVKLEVQDVSGGCGSMYALEIESPKFKGLTVIKQHKLVNSILAEEIKSWHGVQLRTRAV
ncbi:bola-like protein [Aaosphaeria arxii CBS 175.79]|uniref:Bola-like protein n=1 Tax=Aaosphaeria arxii CBS 175.79 TaxID=1450172 RepID=A0A6A5XR30_9PLEO|nr:bola-like protein [Aaosphaeria arxii CBS 175.79]KAF2015393.1 bola-like protein [Aaosphaeria arxii CBS 175.79]